MAGTRNATRLAAAFAVVTLTALVSLPDAQAWRNVPLKERRTEKIPYRPQWVTAVKKGKFFKYKRKEFSSPLVHGDLVFTGSDSGYFYALKKKNGGKAWRFKANAPINSAPAAWNDRVFFGDDDGILHALTISDGKEVWRSELGSEILAAPEVSANRIFVATAEGVVTALSTEDGHVIWQGGRKREFTGQIRMTIRGNASPTVDPSGDRLFVGYADGVVQALTASTGKVLWERKLAADAADAKNSKTAKSLGRFEDVDGKPLVDGDRVYAATFDGGLYALSKQSGSVLWSKPQGSGAAAALLNDGKTLAVAGSNGNLYAYDKTDGSQLWNSPVGKGSLTSPVTFKDIVVVGLSDETMNFLDAEDGHVIARRFAKKGVFSDPVVSEDRIYYLSNGGRLYSLRFVR